MIKHQWLIQKASIRRILNFWNVLKQEMDLASEPVRQLDEKDIVGRFSKKLAAVAGDVEIRNKAYMTPQMLPYKINC